MVNFTAWDLTPCQGCKNIAGQGPTFMSSSSLLQSFRDAVSSSYVGGRVCNSFRHMSRSFFDRVAKVEHMEKTRKRSKIVK